MTITERAAYLKGLMEGLELDAEKKEVKVLNAIVEMLDDMALTVADLEDGYSELSDQLDAVDEDLYSLEEDFYEEDDDYDAAGRRKKLKAPLKSDKAAGSKTPEIDGRKDCRPMIK